LHKRRRRVYFNYIKLVNTKNNELKVKEVKK